MEEGGKKEGLDLGKKSLLASEAAAAGVTNQVRKSRLSCCGDTHNRKSHLGCEEKGADGQTEREREARAREREGS